MNKLIDLYPLILKKLKKSKDNHSYFCLNFLKIITKDGTISPFILNNIQLDFLNKINQYQGKYRKIIILKARQFGMSTFIESLFFRKILFNQGKRAFVIAHQQQSTNAIFNITSMFYQKLPDYLKQIYPQEKANAKEIKIKYNESSIRIGTAGGDEIGRGLTNNYLHCSEVAFWDNPELIIASLNETVADTQDNIIIYESTANGFNFFKNEFEKGLIEDKENNVKSIFYGWNKFSEYRKPIDKKIYKNKNDFYDSMTEEEKNLQRIYKLSLEQINWRRNKIKLDYESREQLFKQEYPIIWQEAFINSIDNPLIEYDKIYEARNNDFRESNIYPIIVGIDPARQGNDRTVITIRQGRKILSIITLKDKTSTEIEGYIINNLINSYDKQIDMIFIDAGYGLDIADHILERGYKKIKAIFFNGKPNNPDKYVNIRSEMFDNVRKWFYQEGGVDIKDNDEISNEYSIIPDLKINSNGKLYMISKDDIKELNQNRSTDYFDSLALTFAEKVFRDDMINNREIFIKRNK